MVLILFSAFINVVVLALICFTRSKIIKLLSIFGCVCSIAILLLWYYVSRPCFAASTPLDISSKNLTDQKLKLYSIVFWENSWNGSGSYVAFDKALSPQESSDFCFEIDGMSEFWIVAKNENDEIIYLKEVTSEPESTMNIRINSRENIDPRKILIARKLTIANDDINQRENILVYINFILLSVTILYIIKKSR